MKPNKTMKSSNTQDQSINWKKINTDDKAKLREIKRLLNDWESQIPVKIYMILMNVLNK
jgi:hypothetical protein